MWTVYTSEFVTLLSAASVRRAMKPASSRIFGWFMPTALEAKNPKKSINRCPVAASKRWTPWLFSRSSTMWRPSVSMCLERTERTASGVIERDSTACIVYEKVEVVNAKNNGLRWRPGAPAEGIIPGEWG